MPEKFGPYIPPHKTRPVSQEGKKRRLPFEKRFSVSLDDLIRTQHERWNDGEVREGVTAWDVAFHLFDIDHDTRRLFCHLNLDENNPFHWRVLLEAFTQTFVTDLGAPKKVSTERGSIEWFQLARDMNAVRRDHFAGRWRPVMVAKHLLTIPPFSARYRGVEVPALRKRISRIAKLIGPMDDEAISRAYDIYRPRESHNPFLVTDEGLDED